MAFCLIQPAPSLWQVEGSDIKSSCLYSYSKSELFAIFTDSVKRYVDAYLWVARHGPLVYIRVVCI